MTELVRISVIIGRNAIFLESMSHLRLVATLPLLVSEGIPRKVNRALEDRKIFAVSQREAQKQLFIESRPVLVADVISDRSKLPKPECNLLMSCVGGL